MEVLVIDLVSRFSSPILIILVSKRNLIVYKDGSNACILRSEISFSISIDISGRPAVDLETSEAVRQAQEATEDMRGLATPIQGANTGIDKANAAAASIVQAADILNPLLSKITVFNNIIKEIAEVRYTPDRSLISRKRLNVALKVHPYAKMAWKILSLAHDVTF